MALENIVTEWQHSRRTERGQLQARIVEGWLTLCQSAVAERNVDEITRWLDRKGARADILDSISDMVEDSNEVGLFYANQMQAYLLCAQAAISDIPHLTDDTMRQASLLTDLPFGFYRDLLASLRPVSQHRESRTRIQCIGALLVEAGQTGLAARLVLERIPRGTSSLYPGITRGFIFRDPQFRQAEEAARLYARSTAGVWNDNSDVRWSLEGIPAGQRSLKGGSLGAGFAAGLHFLFTSPCDLSSSAITATVTPDGTLGAIKGWNTKVQGAKNTDGKIRTVITASDQGDLVAGDKRLEVRQFENVNEVVLCLRRLRARQRRRQMWRAVPTSATLVFVLFGLTASQMTHRYDVKGGGRVVVKSTVSLPYVPNEEIDTGFIQRDFRADSISGLQKRSWLLQLNNPNRWADDIATALPPAVEKARLLLRLGNESQARSLLQHLLQSDSIRERVSAARTLVKADPTQTRIARTALLRVFRRHNGIPDEDYVDVARALIEVDPGQARLVIPAMHTLIRENQNNFVRIPATQTLVAADHREKQFAIRLLEPLLQDPNNGVKAKAAQALFESDPRYADVALQILTPLLLDPNNDVNRAAFEGLNTIGRVYPERVTNTAARIVATSASENSPDVKANLADLVRQLITPTTAYGVMNVVTASDQQSLRMAAEQVDDFFLNDRSDVERNTRFLGVKLADIAKRRVNRQDAPSTTVVEYLLEEMQMPLADRWAIYRHGCAHAIGLCTPANQRKTVAAHLEDMRRKETRPHIRIALARAMEELRD